MPHKLRRERVSNNKVLNLGGGGEGEGGGGGRGREKGGTEEEAEKEKKEERRRRQRKRKEEEDVEEECKLSPIPSIELTNQTFVLSRVFTCIWYLYSSSFF